MTSLLLSSSYSRLILKQERANKVDRTARRPKDKINNSRAWEKYQMNSRISKRCQVVCFWTKGQGLLYQSHASLSGKSWIESKIIIKIQTRATISSRLYKEIMKEMLQEKNTRSWKRKRRRRSLVNLWDEEQEHLKLTWRGESQPSYLSPHKEQSAIWRCSNHKAGAVAQAHAARASFLRTRQPREREPFHLHQERHQLETRDERQQL